MLEALSDAYRERWTTSDELLRLVAMQVDRARRQAVVIAGGEDSEPLEILRPGEESKKKQQGGMRSVVQRALAGLRG